MTHLFAGEFVEANASWSMRSPCSAPAARTILRFGFRQTRAPPR